MKYFIVENNKQSGPFSIYELKDKGITSETLVWGEGMTDWTPAWKVDELRAFLFNTKDASTPPPLPEDMEQPAAAQAEPPAAIEKKKGSSCLKRMFVGFLFLLAVLLVAMAVSCPSEQAHKNKIKEKITLALEQSAQRNNNLFGVGIGLVRHLLTDEILDRVLDEMVDYHNYYVFSKCTINSDGKDKNISYGAFARVFTMNEDDLSRYIDEHNPLSGFEPATGTQQADTTAGTQMQPADGDLMNDIQEEIIGSLSRIVKKQVGERTDSTTSDAINKIVDGVTDMIRNEVNR